MLLRHSLLASFLLCAVSALAQDFTAYLTPARGFTEVTDMSGLSGTPTDCYILTSAEEAGLIVGIGAFEAKPDWASDQTKALRYKAADVDPVLDLSNFFTIEKSGTYVGLRNLAYCADLFQTHDNAGFMYVNTFTDKQLDEWSQLTPTFADGYWLFESGKYPISSGNWASGFLGPWNKSVAAGEPLALNRQNTDDDAAGHFRLWRIARTDLMALHEAAHRQQLLHASASSPVNATWLITNPSFEAGETGWTLVGKDPNGNDEFTARDYGMTGKEGGYLMNAYQWWAPQLAATQTLDLPSGVYCLSGQLCTWEGRTAFLTANGTSATIVGQNDATGIPVAIDFSVGTGDKLTITAGSTGQWWTEGHEGETQTFFKVDDLRLTCKTLFLNGAALPLPNDNATALQPDQWYYFDADYRTDYRLAGTLNGLVYATEGDKPLADIVTAPAEREMTLARGRHYFKASQGGTTLVITKARTMKACEFTAAALNVDGLPNKVLTFTLNEDGPGSDGTKKISQYLAAKGYDLIGCSEDFNYHGSLISSLQDNYSWGKERATLSADGLSIEMLINGFRFDTDGLNLLWKNSTCAASNESWTQWESMEATDGNQYVRKGYRHYDLKLADGSAIDVFILHMDAGDTKATASRESQWRQLAEAVNATDSSRPKLILGDTNSRWTREEIAANFTARLSKSLTATDVWVELCRNGRQPTTDMDDLTDQSDPLNYAAYEIVDKIIYVNPWVGDTPQLVPQSFRIEQDYTYDSVDHDGNTAALGDHRPVVVTFKLLKSGALIGDVNRDDAVTIADVTALVNLILGQDADGHYDRPAADVNGDGAITIADVTALVNLILGQN